MKRIMVAMTVVAMNSWRVHCCSASPCRWPIIHSPACREGKIAPPSPQHPAPQPLSVVACREISTFAPAQTAKQDCNATLSKREPVPGVFSSQDGSSLTGRTSLSLTACDPRTSSAHCRHGAGCSRLHPRTRRVSDRCAGSPSPCKYDG